VNRPQQAAAFVNEPDPFPHRISGTRRFRVNDFSSEVKETRAAQRSSLSCGVGRRSYTSEEIDQGNAALDQELLAAHRTWSKQ
jgi:hypothetical protein